MIFNKILLVLILLSSCSTYGQNMVINGDFEEYIECPKGLKILDKPKMLKYVTNPNSGSFDFIHVCDDDDYPRFRWGKETPQSGQAYTGIAVYQNSILNFGSEYLQLQLKDSLKKGVIYQYEMYLSLADKSHITINNLGVYFSDTLVNLKAKKCLFQPDIISYDFYENKVGWEKYTGDYVARGGEKYIIIGNFHSSEYTRANNTKVIDKRAELKNNYVYYFVDNVSLTKKSVLTKGIVLNNINFKSGSTDLIKNSYSELDKIVSVLISNPKYTIEIQGHTDNVGSEVENLKLSQNRAEVIEKYLIEKGINKSRITSVGKGSKQPIGDNNTEEGRLKNRRVEFVFKHF